MAVMDAMTLDEDQSCQALKPAWMKKTASSTMARARFATAGGSPSGFQETNTNIQPAKRIMPKPLKKYPKICLNQWCGAGERAYFPYSRSRVWIWSDERPCPMSTARRFSSEVVDRVCHSMLDSSALLIPIQCGELRK